MAKTYRRDTTIYSTQTEFLEACSELTTLAATDLVYVYRPAASPLHYKITKNNLAATLIGYLDGMIDKGDIACAANPNYPAADSGNCYRVSTAGKIGGASGTDVDINDIIICFVDSTITGDEATVGANWAVLAGKNRIGNDATASTRTFSKIVATDGVNANISKLEAAIGNNPGSTTYVSTSASTNANIGSLDTQLTNLLTAGNFGEAAYGSLVNSGGAGLGNIYIEAVTCGTAGNSITVTTSNGAGGVIVISVVGTVIDIDLGAATQTTAAVVAALMASAAANALINCKVATAGNIDDAAVDVTLANGAGNLTYDTDDCTNHLKATDFVNANYAENLRNADKLLDKKLGANTSLTAETRTVGQLISTNDVATNLNLLDDVVGADASLTTLRHVVAAGSLYAKLEKLDARLTNNTRFGQNPIATVPSAAANSDVYIEYIAGTPTAPVTVTLNHIAALPITVTYTAGAGTLVIEAITGTSTAAEVAAAINADATVKQLFYASYEGTGAGVVDAFGAGAVLTVPAAVARPNNNPIVLNNSVSQNIDLLDAAIGVDVVPVIRANNAIDAINSVNQNITKLDSAIGVSTTGNTYINPNNSVNENISRLDTVISAATKYTQNQVCTLDSVAANSDLYFESVGATTVATAQTIDGVAAITFVGGVLTITQPFPVTAATIAGIVNNHATIGKLIYCTYEGTGAGNISAVGPIAFTTLAPVVRTNNPIPVGATPSIAIDLLDTAIGTTAQLTNLVNITDDSSVYQKINNLDGVLRASNASSYGMKGFAETSTAVANGEVYIEHLVTGATGVGVTCTFVDTGAAHGTVTLAAGSITVEIENGVTTAAVAAGYINSDTAASKLWKASYSGTGAGLIAAPTATGASAYPTPVVRTNNPIFMDMSDSVCIDKLDAAIGASVTPAARTNNPTFATNAVNVNIDVLDDAIGLTPTSTNVVVAANSVNSNLSAIDAIIGPATVGTKGAGVTTATEYTAGHYHRTVLSGIDISGTINNAGTEAVTGVIYTFPEGAILVHAALADINVYSEVPVCTDNIEVAVGSAAAGAGAALAGTEEDILRKNAGVIALAAAPGTAADNTTAPATAFWNGTGAAIDFHLNMAIAAATWTVGGAGTTVAHITGSVVLVWSFIGDY